MKKEVENVGGWVTGMVGRYLGGKGNSPFFHMVSHMSWEHISGSSQTSDTINTHMCMHTHAHAHK